MIEQILKAIYLPQDKANHVMWGAALFAAFHFYSAPAAFALVVLVAVLKEVYDGLHPKTHSVDVYDALATVAGGAIGLVCTL